MVVLVRISSWTLYHEPPQPTCRRVILESYYFYSIMANRVWFGIGIGAHVNPGKPRSANGHTNIENKK